MIIDKKNNTTISICCADEASNIALNLLRSSSNPRPAHFFRLLPSLYRMGTRNITRNERQILQKSLSTMKSSKENRRSKEISVQQEYFRISTCKEILANLLLKNTFRFRQSNIPILFALKK